MSERPAPSTGSGAGPRYGADVDVDEPATTTRRWFLVGGAAALLGGAGGVAAQLAHRTARATPAPPPELLVAALAAERSLIADLDATTGGSAAVRRVVAQVRADHVAHAAALRGLLATFPPSASSSASAPASPIPPATPRTRAQLRVTEQGAAERAGAAASIAHGHLAALLASIAACEATHVELLR